MDSSGGSSSSNKAVEGRTTTVVDKLGLTKEVQRENQRIYNLQMAAALVPDEYQVTGVIDTGFSNYEAYFADGQVLGKVRRFYLDEEQTNYVDTRKQGCHGTMCAYLIGGVEAEMNHAWKPGIARGVFPKSRLRLYQVLENKYTAGPESDDKSVKTAVRAAINDGVSFLNISMGVTKDNHVNPFSNAMAEGTFEAMLHGILTCVPAGNDGPHGLVENINLWDMVVGALDSDKVVHYEVTLEGLRRKINAYSTKFYPKPLTCKLVDLREVENGEVVGRSDFVVCKADKVPDLKRPEFQKARGIIIIVSERHDAHHDTSTMPIPAFFMNQGEGASLKSYMTEKRYRKEVTLTVEKTTDRRGYTIAQYSSRVQHPLLKWYSKPDVSCYGTLVVSPKPDENVANGELTFSSQIGSSVSTSLGCSVFECVQNLYPEWSKFAVKSAVMTSADDVDWEDTDENYAMGSGAANAEKAVETPVVYDMKPHDFCRLLRDLKDCSDGLRELIKQYDKGGTPIHHDFNYPSFKAVFDFDVELPIHFEFKRTLTCVVGQGLNRTFIHEIRGEAYENGWLKVRVEPEILTFEDSEMEEFTVFVTVRRWSRRKEGLLYAQLVWIDKICPRRQAKSPIRIVRNENNYYQCPFRSASSSCKK